MGASTVDKNIEQSVEFKLTLNSKDYVAGNGTLFQYIAQLIDIPGTGNCSFCKA